MFKQPENNPYIPTEQREIYGQSKATQQVQPSCPQQVPGDRAVSVHQTVQPTLDLKLYQPPPPKPKQSFGGPDISSFMPRMVPGPFYPPQFSYSYVNPLGTVPFMPPIIKNYTISCEGPDGKHSMLSTIYEDALPGKPTPFTFTTLGERITTYQFIRSTLFNNVDGGDIGLSGSNLHSLLSRIKFDELNPYNSYKFSLNPYRGLPYGFLIYRSCYPIRRDRKGYSVVCAKNSMAINVRIYKMVEGSFLFNKLDHQKVYEYPEWREVAFYEYVRENIIKTKMCPNFVNLFGYYISEQSGIDYDGAYRLASNKDKTTLKKEPKFVRVDEFGREVPNIPLPKVKLGGKVYTVPYYRSGVGVPLPYISKDTLKGAKIVGESSDDGGETKPIDMDILFGKEKEKKTEDTTGTTITVETAKKTHIQINPRAYNGKSLVLITESPNYNLFGWATKTYNIEGATKVMINRGIHGNDEWFNVLFQMMVALYVIQINEIIINDFSVENNIFIKDIPVHGQSTNYWKYRIDNIDYYVPNLGYMVLIDSNFKDLDVEGDKTLEERIKEKKDKSPADDKWKLDGRFLGEHSKSVTKTKEDIKKEIFNIVFKKAFDSNLFGKDTENSGIVPPSDDVLIKIGNISTDGISDIGQYIPKYMSRFMHNRIGTLLKDAEIPNVRELAIREIKKGQILVHKIRSDSFRFVLFLNHIHSEGEDVESNAIILTRENPNDEISEHQVNIGELHQYSNVDEIVQTSKIGGPNFTEENLLETYTIIGQ